MSQNAHPCILVPVAVEKLNQEWFCASFLSSDQAGNQILEAILGFLPQACFFYLQNILQVSFMRQNKLLFISHLHMHV